MCPSTYCVTHICIRVEILRFRLRSFSVKLSLMNLVAIDHVWIYFLYHFIIHGISQCMDIKSYRI